MAITGSQLGRVLTAWATTVSRDPVSTRVTMNETCGCVLVSNAAVGWPENAAARGRGPAGLVVRRSACNDRSRGLASWTSLPCSAGRRWIWLEYWEAGRVDVGRVGFAVLPVAAAAGFGGLASRKAPAVYQRLRKPPWAPPASAFGPVWSTLYVAIAVAGWRVYATASPMTRRLQLTQLTFNGAWPAAFFGIRDKRASLVIIAALDLSLGLEIARLLREDRGAAGLLMPYLAWCGFATVLNTAVSEPEANHSE